VVIKTIRSYLTKYLNEKKKLARKKTRKRNLSKNQSKGNILKIGELEKNEKEAKIA